MKITVDKELTLAGHMATVKARAKEFKQRYTDSDLRNAFEESTDYNVYGDILQCEVEAFQKDFFTAELLLKVEMVVGCSIDFKRFRFYVDEDLKVSQAGISYQMFLPYEG